jgi:hypothetical protein
MKIIASIQVENAIIYPWRPNFANKVLLYKFNYGNYTTKHYGCGTTYSALYS